ncbi:MAG: hypothetical protein GXO08_00270 [Aquificae bacterium]|nr:hypothetical protein [Aquificota bacterium]
MRWLPVVLVLVFALLALAVWIGAGLTALLSPELVLVILGALGFGLFAFKLLTTYTAVLLAADRFLSGQPVDKKELAAKTSKETASEEPLFALLALLMASVEPYRYAYYLAFALLLLLTLAAVLTPWNDQFKANLEALFWGSALTTFFVWAFESFASAAVGEVADRERSS